MTKRTVSRVAILGCGRGGPSEACHFTKEGFEVRLFELPSLARNIQPFQEKGGIEISGAITGFYTPKLMTTDIAEALRGAEVIMLTSAAMGHQAHFESMAPHLEDGQIIVVNTSYFACLRFRDLITSTGKRVYLAESNLLPYMVERVSPTSVRLDGIKDEWWVAAFPGTDTPHVVEMVGQVFPPIKAAPNVLYTALRNENPVIHPAVVLSNLALVDHTKGDFEFYGYGMTPSVGKVAEGVDADRLAVAKRFGFTLPTYAQYQSAAYARYGSRGDTIYEVFHTSQAHLPAKYAIPSPAEFNLFNEDVPYGLVPISSLGHKVGVPTPTVDALIHLACLVTGIDYRREGTTIEKLGLAGKTTEEILHLVAVGG
jgi:opine dehydrogenase